MNVSEIRAKFKDAKDIMKKDGRGLKRLELEINSKASVDLNTYWTQRFEEDGKYNFQIDINRADPPATSKINFMIDQGDNDPLYLVS